MRGFLDRFKGEQIDWAKGRAIWSLLAPLRYTSDRMDQTLVVPPAFITDLASVPRAPFTFWLAGGRGIRAAVIHDFAYAFGYWFTVNGTRLVVTRRDADAVFLEALRADPLSGANAVQARLMYAAVRAGGSGVWADRATRLRALNPAWAVEWPIEAP